MKKLFKIILCIFLALFLFLMVGSIYDAKYSPRAREGTRNVARLQNVNIGMSNNEVISIMGQPEITYTIEGESYDYISNDESHPYISLIFDSNMKVIKIYPSNKFNFK